MILRPYKNGSSNYFILSHTLFLSLNHSKRGTKLKNKKELKKKKVAV